MSNISYIFERRQFQRILPHAAGFLLIFLAADWQRDFTQPVGGQEDQQKACRVQQDTLELAPFEDVKNIAHAAARLEPARPFPLCILLDAKARMGVTSEIRIVDQEISAVENWPHCTGGQGPCLPAPKHPANHPEINTCAEKAHCAI